MTTVVRIQIHNLDLRDPLTQTMLSEFDNATFSKSDGLGYMTVYIDDNQGVVETVIEATRKLLNKVAGTSAPRVDPDLVTTSEIAQRVGVSREAVRKWVHGDRKPFPHQFDTVGGNQRVWRWVEVVGWLSQAKSIDMGEQLASMADIAHIDSCLSKVPDVLAHDWATLSTPSGTADTFTLVLVKRKEATVSFKLADHGSSSGRLLRVG